MWRSFLPLWCRPGHATPTPSGFARALGVEWEKEDASGLLTEVAADLLGRIGSRTYPFLREAAENAHFLAPRQLALGTARARRHPAAPTRALKWQFATGLNVWDRLEEWEDEGQRPQGTQFPVTAEEATEFLGQRSWQRSAATAKPAGLCRRRHAGLCSARPAGGEYDRARRSGHGLGQDTGLSLAVLSLGQEEQCAGVDFHLTPRTCSASSIRKLPASCPTRQNAAARSSSARAARIMPACSTCRKSSGVSRQPVRARRCSPR